MNDLKAYNDARERDPRGYAYRGYFIRQPRPAFSDDWTITKDGAHIGTVPTRADAEYAVRLLTDTP